METIELLEELERVVWEKELLEARQYEIEVILTTRSSLREELVND